MNPHLQARRILGLLLCASACVHAAQDRPLKPKPKTDSDPPAEVVNVSGIEPAPRAGIAEVLEPDNTPPENAPPGVPRADISADGEVSLGCWLLLDGSISVNPSGGDVEYAWKQSAGPALPFTPAELKQPRIWIFLASPGDYRWKLRVKNEKGWSLPAERKFSVKPARGALTEAEARRVLGAGERVALPGEGWQQVCGPKVDLNYVEGVSQFRPGLAGLYIFEAPRAGDVPERRGVIVPAGNDSVLGDRRPIAKLPRNLNGQVNKPLMINGSLSFDPDGAEETQQLKPRWILADKYRGVELEPLTNLRARFKATRPGIYAASLVVSDGRLESDPPEQVFIQIDAAAANAPDNDGYIDEDLTGIEKEDVRYRKVSLGLWGNLDRAVQLFPSRCGVALRVDGEFAPPEKFAEIPLALEVMDGPMLHLVDWISRQTDARYRRDGDRSLWLTTQLAWTKQEKLAAVAVLCDELYKSPDGSDLKSWLMPAFQPIIDSRPGSSLDFERSRQELQGVLPLSACARLKEISAMLRVPEGQGLPPREYPAPGEYKLQRALAEKMVTLQKTHRRLDYVLRDFSEAAGVAMGFDPRQFPKGLPHIDIDIQNAPLRDAVRTLCDVVGFDGCNVEPPGGLWFFRGARPYPSGELLWDHALVRAYDLSHLFDRSMPGREPLSGEAVAFAIQRRIYPESWKDVGALCFYHPPTKKLLVVHGAAAHRRILDFLYDLAERGEWALGPVEEAAKK